LKILRDPGISLSYSRHLGFKNSKGDVLIFLDGDILLSNSFKHYLELELKDNDLISPMFEWIPLDKATRVFSWFAKAVIYIQKNAVEKSSNISDPSILPQARIYKREVLEKMNGYSVSSSFFGEDRIVTALAIKLGFRYKFSTRLRLLKIDDPGYQSYWKKHFRYALGIHRDLTPLGRSILRNYIIARRLNHINAFFPVLSLIYAWRTYLLTRSFKNSIEVALMKYMVDFAMLAGDLKGSIYAGR
jgi:glycosyltransferase involved in cell wall biosynthesis